jgi:hypothetical protein
VASAASHSSLKKSVSGLFGLLRVLKAGSILRPAASGLFGLQTHGVCWTGKRRTLVIGRDNPRDLARGC